MERSIKHNRIALPDFLVIGAMKSGTSSLHDILRQHSKIFLPPEKEIHFFDTDNYNKGVEYYSSFFKKANHTQLIGEITPRYIFNPNSAKRIVKTLGTNIKIIVILRNPADRAYSHYKMNVLKNTEKRSFEDAVQQELEILNKENAYYNFDRYISRGLYGQQLRRYLSFFSKDQIHVVLFEEDFLKNKQNTVNQILEFLNLSQEKLLLNIRSNASERKVSTMMDRLLNTPNFLNHLAKSIIPSEKYRIFLKSKLTKLNSVNNSFSGEELQSLKPMLIREVFYEDIIKLEKIIDRDLSGWYSDFV